MNKTERFEQTISQFGPAIARIAASYEIDPRIREDLLQEIGLALWTSIGNYSGKGSFKGFVLRIAHNKAADHVAKEMTKKKYLSATEHEIGHTPTFETNIQINQEQAKLISAVQKMNLPHKQVMTLLLEDMSYSDIAEILGISVSNVGARVNRAKHWLKEHLR